MSSHPRDRAQRRAETLRICSKRKLRWKSPPFNCDRWVPGRYAKDHGECHCSKAAHGRPRISAGMCCRGLRDRIYIWRRLTKQIDLAIRHGADPYGDEVARFDHTFDYLE